MTRKPLVLHAIDDARNIANINRRAISAALDDDIAITFGGFDLAVRAEND